MNNKGILRISESLLKEILGIKGDIVAARIDHFTGDALELSIINDPRMPEYREGEVPQVIDYEDIK